MPDCNVHGCQNRAVWYWENPVTGNSGYKCDSHAQELARMSGYGMEEMKREGVMRRIADAN